MALVKKDVLWCGRWDYPDDVLTLGPNDMARATANGNRMLAKGLGVKFCWEHQPNVVPKPASVWAGELADPNAAAKWAKSVITDAVGFEAGRNDAGKPTVFALFDDSKLTPDERRQMERAGKVSCRLDHNYRDPATGEQYDGWSISHIAVTPKPVHANQGPFVQMSRADWPSDRTVYMGEGKPMADKAADDDKKPMPKDEAPAEDAEPDGDEADDFEEPDDSADTSMFGQVLTALQGAYGFMPADGVVNWQTLVVALNTIAANKDAAGGEPEAALDPNSDAATTGAPGGAMPMMMSQVAMAKTHPGRVANDRAEIRGEIKALAREGRLPAFAVDQLLKDFGDGKTGFQMSYNSTNGTLARNGLLAAVDGIKKYVPKGLFLAQQVRKKVKQMSAAGNATTPAAKPERFATTNSTPDNEAEKIAALAASRNNPNAKS